MTIQILGGSTSQTVRLFIQDTSKTDGSGLTGLVHNTSGLTAYYAKGATGSAAVLTLQGQTPTGAWVTGGFVAVDGTNMPGVYRLDIPNAALDSEVETIVMLRGAANMAPVLLRVMGGKSQANAVTVADKTGYTLSTAGVNAIADQVWDEAYADHTTAGTFGKLMNLLRQANTVLEGTVLASPTPTTTVFRLSGIDYPTGALEHSVLWMASGASQEQNSPILTTVNNGDGTVTVTLEEPLTTAPQAGDTVLIDPTSHVHAIADIQAGLALQSTLLSAKSVTDKLNTGLIADGLVFQFTANMLELAPAAAGGGSATIENQELILEELDTLRSSFAAAVGRLAVASQITGFPAALVRNSDYSTVTESEIRLSLSDLDGNPITEIGGVQCSEIEWLFGLGSERAPAIIEGAATWDNANNQLVIQIDADDTAATSLGTLSWQIGCTIDTTTRYLGGGTTRLIERQF